MLDGFKSLFPNTRKGREKKIRQNNEMIQWHKEQIDILEHENEQERRKLEKKP